MFLACPSSILRDGRIFHFSQIKRDVPATANNEFTKSIRMCARQCGSQMGLEPLDDCLHFHDAVWVCVTCISGSPGI